MKVTILGGTGFAGKRILEQLLAENYEVTALVRNPDKLLIKAKNLTIIQGNARNLADVERAVKEAKIVIQALGIGGKGDGKPNNFVSLATEILITAMKKKQVKQLIALSNIGVGESKKSQPWIFTKVILPYFMKWLKVIIDDKEKMEIAIKNSGLNYLILRCPNIVEKPKKGKIQATTKHEKLKLSITNLDLAAFLVEQIKKPLYWNKAVSVSN